ncbi:adenylate/guanylate cyclase domain-containing protein [Candidatus Poriferisodalis sp.]|uniref:adenylate/guanylate cyclase domain-containing protein n=1 Tax=Candidatus Poriferisodalis sp. TaxID=3101277 RepID=UPI003B51FD3D
MSCPVCATEVPPSARYCPSCGNLLVQTEERRVVTVLFSDLVGFTSMGEAADPEELKHMVDRCFQRLVADITAFGGTVDKIIGDAILALFGAPTAHEDDPERALRAAFRMQRSLEDFNAERGLDLQMRIGINTGEVLVGALAAGGDYTAMGDTVNIASRLQTIAEAGEVLVGGATHAATSGVVEYTPRGEIGLRGRDEPVEVFVASGELAPPGRRRSASLSPLVGRDLEYALLQSALDTSVARRRAQLVQIVAEAGMGKTRLAREAAAEAEARHGAIVLESMALPYDETNPLRCIGDAIASAAGVGSNDSTVVATRRISSLVADVLQPQSADFSEPDSFAAGSYEEIDEITDVVLAVLGRVGSGDAAEIEWRAEATLRSLRRFLGALARRRPVVLLLSDVHWADERLLLLLEQLLASLATQPFVVITTARWTVDEQRWQVPPGRHSTVVLNLDPLSREATTELVAELLGANVHAHIAEQLYERSGGNPFFLEEISVLLREAGVVGPGARSDHEERSIAELPHTLRGLVAARLDALSAPERRLVDAASVIGGGGSVSDLLALAAPDVDADLDADADADSVRDSVFQRLVDKDILTSETDSWTFRSDVVRDVAYSMLTKVARAERHLDVALWLAQNRDDPSGESVGVIADHFASAVELGAGDQAGRADAAAAEIGGPGRTAPKRNDEDPFEGGMSEVAIEWLGRAGAWAAARDSHYAAAQFYQRAIELLGDADPRLIDMALGRAAARLRLGELHGARADAELARALATLDGNRIAAAHGLRVLGEIALAEDDHAAADKLLADALDQFRTMGEVREAAETLRLRGLASLRGGDYGRADRYINEANGTFGHLGDETGAAWCLQNLAWLSFEQGLIAEAGDRLHTAIERFSELGDMLGLATAQGLLAFLRFHAGQRDEAEDLAHMVHGIAHERGERFTEAMMDLLLASLGLWSGRALAAVDRARAAEHVFRQVHSDFGVVQALGLLGRSFAAVGELQRSRAVLAECFQRATDMPGRPLEGFARAVRAGAAVQMGSPESAMEELLRAGWDARSGFDDPAAPPVPVRSGPNERTAVIGLLDLEVSLGLALLQLGRPEDAVTALEAVPVEEGLPSTYLNSSLAMAYVSVGRTAEALERSRAAMASGTGTYLDVRTALVARALAHARDADRPAMEATFEQVMNIIDETDSRLSQAVVRLARAIGHEAFDAPDTADLQAETEMAIIQLGARPTGWETAFRLAAGLSVSKEVVSGTLPEAIPYPGDSDQPAHPGR